MARAYLLPTATLVVQQFTEWLLLVVEQVGVELVTPLQRLWAEQVEVVLHLPPTLTLLHQQVELVIQAHLLLLLEDQVQLATVVEVEPTLILLVVHELGTLEVLAYQVVAVVVGSRNQAVLITQQVVLAVKV